MQYLMIFFFLFLYKKKKALIKKKKFCSVDRISESYLVARVKHLENVFAEVVILEAGREEMKLAAGLF